MRHDQRRLGYGHDAGGRCPASRWHLYIPKLITVLRQGLGPAELRADILAGLTVAIVALPLAMALAIASGTTPDKGLVTAVVGGLFGSAPGGARSPLAGIIHALFLLGFMLVAMPPVAYVPLAALAAVLVVVAWNMSGRHKIRHIMTTAPIGERLVPAFALALTVLVDRTVAIQVGVVLSAILFMHGIAEAVSLNHDGARILVLDQRDALPPG